ncbi:MAG: DMT family transporter [Acidimicrobiales bacterium]
MALSGVAAGVTTAIVSSPLAAALIERAMGDRRLSGRFAAARAVAVAGAVLLGTSGAHLDPTAPPHRDLGILLGLVAGCCYGAYSVAAARLIRTGHPSTDVMGAMFGLAALVLLPVLSVTGGQLLGSPRGIAVVAYLAVVPMGLGYLLFGRGLQETPTSVATALSLLEPVVAAVVAEIIAQQRATLAGWAGIALVASSVVVLSATGTSSAGPAAPPASR